MKKYCRVCRKDMDEELREMLKSSGDGMVFVTSQDISVNTLPICLNCWAKEAPHPLDIKLGRAR